jgi:hypothetical protein
MCWTLSSAWEMYGNLYSILLYTIKNKRVNMCGNKWKFSREAKGERSFIDKIILKQGSARAEGCGGEQHELLGEEHSRQD